MKTRANKVSMKIKTEVSEKTQINRKKKCNPDVLRACENILKKCTQKDMKMMAREFMKEQGFHNEI
jgi:ribosomal protein S6